MRVLRSTVDASRRADLALWRVCGLALTLLLLAPVAARAEGTPARAPSPEELLRQMSATLKDAGSFRFHAEISFDDVLVSGQKLQYAGAVDATVRPPNGVYLDYRDDLSAKRFWYDGRTGTLLDVTHGRYSQTDLPDTLDAAVQQLEERYQLSLPLADLISSDVFATIDANALAWVYLGVHDVEGTPAHHIAVVGANADLQLWIQKDGQPLPLKLVITYKNAPAAPQYQAVLMDWKLGAKVGDDTFAPDLPKDAKRIEFLVAEGSR